MNRRACIWRTHRKVRVTELTRGGCFSLKSVSISVHPWSPQKSDRAFVTSFPHHCQKKLKEVRIQMRSYGVYKIKQNLWALDYIRRRKHVEPCSAA